MIRGRSGLVALVAVVLFPAFVLLAVREQQTVLLQGYALSFGVGRCLISWWNDAGRRVSRLLDPLGLLLIGVAVVLALGGGMVSALLYPVMVNLLLLIAFGWSLLRPPSAVERLARVREARLPDYAVPYLRRVTQVWIGFFLLNGTVSALTVFLASVEVWALYNGVLAYLLIGSLFLAEYLYRRTYIARQEALRQA